MQTTFWHPQPLDLHTTLATHLRQWLLNPGSFMQRLELHVDTKPQIQILQQSWEVPQLDERSLLCLRNRQAAYIREVLISNGHQHWMYARTVFPKAMLTGKEKRFFYLKNRSLGSILFDPAENFVRGEFEFSQLKPNTFLYEKVKAWSHHQALWARRSVFNLDKKSLLLTEVFLPGMTALC